MSYLLGTGAQQRGSGFPFASTRIAWQDTNPRRSEAPTGFGWSLQKVAAWACVTLTATMTEVLPLDLYSGDGADKRPRAMPSWLSDLGGD